MSNLFGIALDQPSLRWAAAGGVSETVIAAVSLLHQRSVEEIAGKLSRQSSRTLPGSLAAAQAATRPERTMRLGFAKCSG